MSNIGQQEPNLFNGYYYGMNNPLNYGAYIPNSQVVYVPNYPGTYNGYPPQNGSTDPMETKFAKLAKAHFKDMSSNVEKIQSAIKTFIVTFEKVHTILTHTIRISINMTENRDKYKATFNNMWKSLKLYKLFRWLYANFLNLLGRQVPLHQEGDTIKPTAKTHEVSYGLLAFLGVISVTPYFISQWFESNAEGPMDPKYWKDAGYPVKVIRDFVADTPNKMTVRVNDKLILAPRILQSDMNLDDTEFVYATHNGRCGLVSIKHLAVDPPEQTQTTL